jgi:energy-coupling factor transport system substrate-specific component
MLAWGLCGVAGGLLGHATRRVPRLAMALGCAAAGFGFGWVMDFYTWTYTQHSLAQYLFIQGESFPFDLTGAIANFVFYMAFGPALVRALERFRLRLDVRFVGAGALLLALVTLAGATQPPRVEAASLSPAARELAYLRGAQNADGGFGAAPGQPSTQLYTAWAVIGLAAAGQDPARLERDGHDPVAWIEGHLPELQGAGDIERTILALAAAHAKLGTLPAKLSLDQARDGSFADQSNLTSFAILALEAAHSGRIDAAASWLARQQNPDGGFSFAARGSQGDIDDTAACIEALVAAGGPHATIERAVTYIERARNGDGGYPEEPGGASDAQSTAWAVQALLAAGAKPLGDSYLEALTAGSGAVAYARGESITPVWVTAQALTALAGRPLD